MDAETREPFRRELEETRAGLQAGLENKNDDTATVTLDGSIGRLSRIDALQSQQFAPGLKARQQQQLLRVQNALDDVDPKKMGRRRDGRTVVGPRHLPSKDQAFILAAVSARGARDLIAAELALAGRIEGRDYLLVA